MKKNLLCFFTLLTFVLSSCEKDIDFQYEEQTITSSDFDICIAQECPKITVSHIAFKNPTALTVPVNNWIIQTIAATLNQKERPSQTLEDILQRFINDAQTGYPETIVLSDAHELTVEVALMYASNDVVSLGYYSDLFDGGAHGFYQEEYTNFNPKTGALLPNGALVKETFSAFAKAKFSQSYPNNTFEISPNIFTTEHTLQVGFIPEGMILRYNDPDIFPVPDKDYKITIPWEEAEDYLTF